MAVDQQRQHQPRIVLRLAAGLPVRPERLQTHPLRCRHNKVSEIVLGQPILQLRRQQKRPIALDRGIRAKADSDSEPRRTAIPIEAGR